MKDYILAVEYEPSDTYAYPVREKPVESSYNRANIVSHLFQGILSETERMSDDSLREHVESVARMLRDKLEMIPSHAIQRLPLPKLTLEISDDHAFMEWPFPNFRIGFSFDAEEPASYFILTNTALGEITASGALAGKEDAITTQIVRFVLNNI